MLHYSVSLLPKAHLLRIRLKIDAYQASTLVLRLPTWISGSYKIRDFARHVRAVEVITERERLRFKKTGLATWSLCIPNTLHGQSFEVTYDCWAFDDSVREAYVDTQRGFINPAVALLYPESIEDAPIRLDVVSDAAETVGWTSVSALERTEEDVDFPLGSFIAKDYETLIDSPILLGKLTTLSFKAYGTPHIISINALLPNFDAARLVQDLKSICETTIAFFDPKERRCPAQRYAFLLNTAGNTYGGLEHSASAALASELHTLPCTLDSKRSSDYMDLLRLCAHEYFHAWWVKRVKPASFIGTDYCKEVPSDLLWLFEGVTSYYEDRILFYAGLEDETAYLDALGKKLQSVLDSPAPNVQTLSEAGSEAWIKFYQPNANAINAYVNYYKQGALLTWILDLSLRQESQGQASFDELLRTFWFDYLQDTTHYQGIDTPTLRKTILTMGSLRPFSLLAELEQTTRHFPYAAFVEPFGLRLLKREPRPLQEQLGIIGHFSDAGFVVKQVLERSVAMATGLSPNDTVIAIDGYRIREKTFEKLLKRHAPGETVRLTFFHGEALLEKSATLKKPLRQPSRITVSKRSRIPAGWLTPRQ